jgi:hypothetical protein
VVRTVSDVQVSNSRGVVVGNDCRLKNRDHYHVEYVTVDPEPWRFLVKGVPVRARVAMASMVLAVVFAGLGVFFINQDLGTADQIASVASFFVGLAALVLAVVSMVMARRTPPDASRVTISRSKNIQTGNGSVMNVTEGPQNR